MDMNSKIEFTEPQKIWLEEVYSKIKMNKPINKRALMVELLGKLPKNFNPDEIDSRLLRGESNITLLGIGLIDPNSALIVKANQVLQGIREVLKQNPQKEDIEVYDVSYYTGLLNNEVADIFERLSYLGMFHNFGTGYVGYGWHSIKVSEKAFENYLNYESIEQIIEDFVEDNSAISSTQNEHSGYDVVLSFAGEDRSHAERLAEELRKKGVKVFYDKYEQAILWGKDLYAYLSDIYQNKAKFCVMFCSRHYAEKLWTNHERQAAQARAIREQAEYILPIRLDQSEIPGVLRTTGHIDWHDESAENIASLVVEKLKSQ